MSPDKLNLTSLASPVFVKDLERILSIEPPVLIRLAAKVNTDGGIRLRESDYPEVFKIWAETGKPNEELKDVLSVIKHLFDESVDKEASVDEVLAELAEFCTSRELTGFDERSEAIRQLLSPKKGYLERRRIQPYAEGVDWDLSSTSGVVQLRAAFPDSKSAQVLGYIPVASIGLQLNRGAGTSEPDQKRITFQVTERGLAVLIKRLQAYLKQLRTIKANLREDVTCYEDHWVRDE